MPILFFISFSGYKEYWRPVIKDLKRHESYSTFEKLWTKPFNAMSGKLYKCSKLKKYLSECKFKGQKLVNVYKATETSSADNATIQLEEIIGNLPHLFRV